MATTADILQFPAHRVIRSPRQLADSHDLLDALIDEWNIGAETLVAEYKSTISGLSDDNKRQDCKEGSQEAW